MVEYTAAAYDVETGVEEKMGVFVEKKRSTGWIWKILVALLLIALCLGGARLFIWFWNERPKITVRSISILHRFSSMFLH